MSATAPFGRRVWSGEERSAPDRSVCASPARRDSSGNGPQALASLSAIGTPLHNLKASWQLVHKVRHALRAARATTWCGRRWFSGSMGIGSSRTMSPLVKSRIRRPGHLGGSFIELKSYQDRTNQVGSWSRAAERTVICCCPTGDTPRAARRGGCLAPVEPLGDTGCFSSLLPR
jgi:hypothetical protein